MAVRARNGQLVTVSPRKPRDTVHVWPLHDSIKNISFFLVRDIRARASRAIGVSVPL
jgi:hypothetical protein